MAVSSLTWEWSLGIGKIGPRTHLAHLGKRPVGPIGPIWPGTHLAHWPKFGLGTNLCGWSKN